MHCNRPPAERCRRREIYGATTPAYPFGDFLSQPVSSIRFLNDLWLDHSLPTGRRVSAGPRSRQSTPARATTGFPLQRPRIAARGAAARRLGVRPQSAIPAVTAVAAAAAVAAAGRRWQRRRLSLKRHLCRDESAARRPR